MDDFVDSFVISFPCLFSHVLSSPSRVSFDMVDKIVVPSAPRALGCYFFRGAILTDL